MATIAQSLGDILIYPSDEELAGINQKWLNSKEDFDTYQDRLEAGDCEE